LDYSELFVGSSLGVFLKDHLSADINLCVHSRCRGLRDATPKRVPPLPFFPTATVCSTQAFVDLLHSTTDHEVHLDSLAEG
jgi:hypothetical protein